MGKNLNQTLLLGLLTLLGLGLVQVYSSSYIFATEAHQNGLYFVIKQGISILLGLGLMSAGMLVPWRVWQKSFIPMWGFCLLALILTLVPGIGVRVGGASRWLDLRLFRFEPAEFLKILVPWCFSYLHSHWQDAGHWSRKPLGWLFWLSPLGLLLSQPDFGSFALIIFVVLLLLFVEGFSWRRFALMAGLLIPSFAFLIIQYPYRLARVIAFINPWADPSNSGFQLIQSLLSVRNGGFWGQGLGAGQGKLFFLPEAHTDFTFAVLAEEAGFLGVALVFLLFGYIFLRSFQIGLGLRRDDQKLMVFGLTFLFGLNSIINIAVALGMLPTKGLTLPFMSYGGSSLICYCLAFGWILNLSKKTEVP